MNYLHESSMEEIDYLREGTPEVPNNASILKQPSFEYELVGNTLWVFKEYKNQDVLFRMQYKNNIGFQVIAEPFPTSEKAKAKEKTPYNYNSYTGVFNLAGEQMPQTDKIKLIQTENQTNQDNEFLNFDGYGVTNLPEKYYKVISKMITFYVKLFTNFK